MLISTLFKQLERMTDKLSQACKKWGLKINTEKHKTITTTERHLKVNGIDVENVTNFKFLSSFVPSCKSDIVSRILSSTTCIGKTQAKYMKSEYRGRYISTHHLFNLMSSMELRHGTMEGT